mgnify:FL=1
MKISLNLASLLFALLCTAVTASAVPGRAEVKKVAGKATVTNAKNVTSSITEGMVLGTGDTITTGAASYVDLYLGLNGDFLRVDADTTLKIDNLDTANINERTVTTQLDVQQGKILGNVISKLSAASKYEIKTASGVAGIRGTKFAVYRTPTTTSIVCTEGTVTFVDRGVVITIPAGKTYLTPPATNLTGQALQAYLNKGVVQASPQDMNIVNVTVAKIAGVVNMGDAVTFGNTTQNTISTR